MKKVSVGTLCLTITPFCMEELFSLQKVSSPTKSQQFVYTIVVMLSMTKPFSRSTSLQSKNILSIQKGINFYSNSKGIINNVPCI